MFSQKLVITADTNINKIKCYGDVLFKKRFSSQCCCTYASKQPQLSVILVQTKEKQQLLDKTSLIWARANRVEWK